MKSGFTLIELIIVISIVFVLVTIAVISINPRERLAQARDTGRSSAISQLGHAVQAYYTVRVENPNPNLWAEDLLFTNSIANFPEGINYTLDGTQSCVTNVMPIGKPTYCYAVNDFGAIVFATAEAETRRSRCSDSTAYFAFSTSDGRSGLVCFENDPEPWEPGSVTYLD